MKKRFCSIIKTKTCKRRLWTLAFSYEEAESDFRNAIGFEGFDIWPFEI